MTERVEEISTLIFERAKDCWSGEFPISLDVARYIARELIRAGLHTEDYCRIERGELKTALAQAEREREAMEEKCRVFDLDDIGRVIQERDEARAEVERLNADLRVADEYAHQMASRWNKAEADLARVRAALDDALDHFGSCGPDDDVRTGEVTDAVYQSWRAALEGRG